MSDRTQVVQEAASMQELSAAQLEAVSGGDVAPHSITDQLDVERDLPEDTSTIFYVP